jgi:hypothetical protein
MQNDEIELRILRYLDDGFENSDYIAEIVTALPLPEICDLICELLRSEDFDTIGMTGLFLRDTMLIGRHSNDCTAFREYFSDSTIVKTLEKLLFSDNYFTQLEVIYTLGKTCSYKSKYALRWAFALFRDSNPLLLDRLLCEMQWLGVEDLEQCIESMATSNSSYLTRWAAVSRIAPIGETIDDGIVQWAEALRHDDCELIRLEAEYEYQRVLKSLQTSILSKAEQRQRAKEIKKIQPLLSFQSVSIRFMKYLLNIGSNHYEVAEFESFVDKLWKELQSS